VVPGSFAACSAPGTRTVPETGEESVRRPIVRRLAFQLGSRRAGTFPAFYSSVISMLGADTISASAQQPEPKTFLRTNTPERRGAAST
jgi:hypothetical protein